MSGMFLCELYKHICMDMISQLATTPNVNNMIYLNSHNADKRALLSTLWAFVLINILCRNMHELLRPDVLFELMSGTLNGVAISEPSILMGSVLFELQIAMIVLCRLLPERANTWTNLVVAAVSIVLVVTQVKNDLDDYFFATVQFAGISAIIWFACIQERVNRALLLLAPPVR